MTTKKLTRDQQIADKTNDMNQDNTRELSGREYLETRDAVIEADREARRSFFKFKGTKSFSAEDLTQKIVDRRNQYGTGSVAYRIKEGVWRVVNYVEDYPTTTYSTKNGRAHGDEVTCEKPHRVVRHWDNGKIVLRTKQAMSQVKPSKRVQTR